MTPAGPPKFPAIGPQTPAEWDRFWRWLLDLYRKTAGSIDPAAALTLIPMAPRPVRGEDEAEIAAVRPPAPKPPADELNDLVVLLIARPPYPNPNAAGGTVTSVALTVPSWLTVSGSPVTGAGTLAVTATTGETANQFLATPNGSTGAVGLRAIVAADLPAGTGSISGQATSNPWFATPTSSRALGTAYQNLTGKPIFVVVSADSTNPSLGMALEAFSDSSATPTTTVAFQSDTGAGSIAAVSFWVLPNNYYKVSNQLGSPSVFSWVEWN